jgi:DNA polymerase III subunit delta'
VTFDTFAGNPKIIQRLRGKLREGRFPHALIFSGPEGVGKHTCALMIAKALNCLKTSGEDFCDKCSSCRKIQSGTHPDVMTISVEEDATQIKIAQVRQILSMLDLQPLEGRSKVFIIDPADSLNAEASNALLKGLEEPPENTFFVLVTVNVNELLFTVRSRCQIYNFAPLTLDEVRRQGITDELAVRWSQGSIGRARALDATRLKSEREVLLDFFETAVTANEDRFEDLIAASAELGRAKLEFESRMVILSVLIADVLYIKEQVADKVVNIDIQDRLTELAGQTSADRLIRMSEFLMFIETSLKTHANRQMLSDALALTANEAVARWLY